MTHFIYRFLIIILFPVLISCQDSVNSSENISGDWLIPANEIYDGGPGKDGIPAISKPVLSNNESIDYMQDNDLIIGIKINNQVKGYTHLVLNWHEIINDKIDDNNFTITYCPLTGSAIGLNRSINGEITTFGVSGLLYNSNLIPYDRATNSNWSQMKMKCVNGQLKGTEFNYIHTFETSWATWKKIFPNALVVTSNTGYSRQYSSYPYGSYRVDESLIFPITNRNNELPIKERVHGIIENESVFAFRFNSFENGIKLISKEIDGNNYLIVGSKTDNFIVSFYNSLQQGTELNFEVVNDSVLVQRELEFLLKTLREKRDKFSQHFSPYIALI
ncbi:MAG: DUF3179 domain-containing protein [Melioribacteraceae bacterium]|jgi:hypothetical protein|nr:DUF3179 domain-containing protein [Melioribacteraceae bacterium]